MKKIWIPVLSAAVLILVMTLAVSLTAALASEKATADLVLHITGFGSDQGKAMVAIVNSEKNFDSDGPPYLAMILPIRNQEATQTVTLPLGEYAVKVYHDANENGQLDTLIFGIPKEKYGFSNNARGSMGPPPYEKAKFTLESPKKSLAIKVQ